jgi:hypothetical protein
MKRSLKMLFIIAAASVLSLTVFSCTSSEQLQEERAVDREAEDGQSAQKDPEVIDDEKGNQIIGMPSDTIPSEQGHIMIGNVGDFTFEPSDIKTLRDDIFNEGYFSIFDILAHLDENGTIDMEYHFDDDMNTYVIDSINGMENWWYIAYYDGGWPERSAYRMDHYPYKERMYISISEAEERQLEDYYEVFRQEIRRKNENGGKIIVPEVIITTPGDFLMLFENVEIKPHDLRSDIFKPGAITAIDAVMTLGDMGEIEYSLNWYESVGTAGLVKNYFVDRINEDESFNRCGFVYEEGSYRFEGFVGNHIHIPSDSRIINSPEYITFFWICI